MKAVLRQLLKTASNIERAQSIECDYPAMIYKSALSDCGYFLYMKRREKPDFKSSVVKLVLIVTQAGRIFICGIFMLVAASLFFTILSVCLLIDLLLLKHWRQKNHRRRAVIPNSVYASTRLPSSAPSGMMRANPFRQSVDTLP